MAKSKYNFATVATMGEKPLDKDKDDGKFFARWKVLKSKASATLRDYNYGNAAYGTNAHAMHIAGTGRQVEYSEAKAAAADQLKLVKALLGETIVNYLESKCANFDLITSDSRKQAAVESRKAAQAAMKAVQVKFGAELGYDAKASGWVKKYYLDAVAAKQAVKDSRALEIYLEQQEQAKKAKAEAKIKKANAQAEAAQAESEAKHKVEQKPVVPLRK